MSRTTTPADPLNCPTYESSRSLSPRLSRTAAAAGWAAEARLATTNIAPAQAVPRIAPYARQPVAGNAGENAPEQGYLITIRDSPRPDEAPRPPRMRQPIVIAARSATPASAAHPRASDCARAKSRRGRITYSFDLALPWERFALVASLLLGTAASQLPSADY